jgi:hypothetical protein
MVRTAYSQEMGEEVFLECDGSLSDFGVDWVDETPEEFLCWFWQGSGTERTSPFLTQQRTKPNFQSKDRRAVNFVFQPLSRTPVFTK